MEENEKRNCGFRNCKNLADSFWKLREDDYVKYILARCSSHPLRDDEMSEGFMKVQIDQKEYEVRLIMSE